MENETSREEIGSRSGLLMAACNLCLSAAYFIVGTIGNSIAVISEGTDNLVDACSSLLLLLGFKISARGKDRMHPNGHGRIEYVAGLLISELILFAAFTLGRESIGRFRNPDPVGALLPILLTACIGAGLKLVMASYIKKQNKELNSSALEAYQKNILADIKGIVLVAVSPLLQQFTTLPVDAAAGLVIAVMIAVDGIKSFGKNVSLLMGEGLNREETEEIVQLLDSYGAAVQLESFQLHDYGPEEKEGTMVLAISPDVSYTVIQQITRDCKERIQEKLNIHVTVCLNLDQVEIPDRTFIKYSLFAAARQRILSFRKSFPM